MKVFALYGDLTLAAANFNSGVAAAKAQMEDLRGEMGGMQDEATKTGGVLEGAFGHALGDMLSDITQAAIETAFEFTRNSIDVASSMEQTNEKLKVLFGPEGSADIRRWAETTKTQYGISAQAAKQYVADVAGLWGSEHLGFTSEELIDMATGLVELTGDLASFNNFTVEETWKKILSGMRGETEAIEDLGIDLRAASIAPFFDMTAKEWGALDQHTRILNTYTYAMAMTTHAQGDFARTSDSYQNQMALFNANIEELQASLGEKLLPAMTSIVGWFNSLFGSQESANESVEDFADSISTSYADIAVTTANALALVNALDELSAATEDAASTEMWGAILSQLQQTIPGIGSLINENTGTIEGGTKALREYADEWASVQREMAMSAALQDYQYDVTAKARDIAVLQNELYLTRQLAESAEPNIARVVEEAREYLGLAEDAARGQVISEVALAADDNDVVAQYYAKQLAEFEEAPGKIYELESQLAVAQAEFADLQARYETMAAQVDKLVQGTAADAQEGGSEKGSPDALALQAIDAAVARMANVPAPTVNVSVVVGTEELTPVIVTEVDRSLHRLISGKSR